MTVVWVFMLLSDYKAITKCSRVFICMLAGKTRSFVAELTLMLDRTFHPN